MKARIAIACCWECGDDGAHTIGERRGRRRPDGTYNDRFRVHCGNWRCKERGPSAGTRDEAIALWNAKMRGKPCPR